MNYFSIKNWKVYQHYKDRRPPWIKLHNSLLDDYEYQALSDASKLHLISIWLLASRSNKVNGDKEPLLPCDEKYLTKLSGMKSPVRLKPLIDIGFLVVASNTLAGRLQGATLETEAYKEETETDPIVVEVINHLNETTGASYKQTTKSTIQAIRARLKDGHTLGDFKTVHSKKYEEWKDTEYEKYLRPSTLYTPTNFEEYLNQVINKKVGKHDWMKEIK